MLKFGVVPVKSLTVRGTLVDAVLFRAAVGQVAADGERRRVLQVRRVREVTYSLLDTEGRV